MTKLVTAATRRVSASSGAVFRIGFGVVALILVIRFFANGWVDSLLVDPVFHYPYPGFEWVRAWPSPWMHLHFALIGIAAVAIVVGYRYRLASAVFAVALAYVEMIDRTLYLNHYYWLVITAGLMVFLPLHAAYSLDARQGRVRAPGGYPAWVVWLLRLQVGMVYFFAGLAKVNADWLLNAEPLSTWLPARSDMWLVGPLLAVPATAFALSWAGAFFDLTIVVWLSWRRTRPYAYAAVTTFHVATWLLFPSIGLFPLVMTASALVFFHPAWPEHFVSSPHVTEHGSRARLRPGWVFLAVVYALAMVAIPLRHNFIPGDVKWTGEGYLGSWQVMLAEKSASASFVVVDPDTGDSWVVGPPAYLTERQRMVMATDPVMIRQTAQLIADDLGNGVEVAADVRMSFNGRVSTRFTDSGVIVSGLPPTEHIDGFILAQPDR